ncbi:MAG: hypothetical protein JO041_16365 [Acidobacteria bacterium]|nr:hypothetical protein [Acidobacteriota bacterium]
MASKHAPGLAAFAAALLLMAATPGCSHKAALNLHSELGRSFSPAESGEPLLLAAYQPWFGHGNHLNVGYSSQDPAVLRRQIEQARELGISAFVVNWYGPRYEYEDRSYGLLQSAAAGAGFHTALMYDEDVNNSGPATDKVIVDLQYAYDRYIGPNAISSRSAYLRLNGRPVVFIFPKGGGTDWDRVRQVANSWEEPPLLLMKDIQARFASDFDGFYAWVQPGAEGWARDGSNWGHDYLEDFYRRMSSQFPDKLAVGAAWPGFDDSQAAWSRNRHISSRCGRTFDESLHLYRRYYGGSHPLPFLLIETWNDYEEGTAIERGIDTCTGPTHGSPAGAQR